MPVFNNSDLYDPTRGFRVWNIAEIVRSPGEVNKYVPNKNDLVFDPANGWFIVIRVEEGTHVAELEKWHLPPEPDVDGDENMLVGIGPGYASESYRAFLDTSVTPHVLAPDARLHFYGSQVASWVCFLGADISEDTGVIISEFYNSSGDFLGPNVPVETIEIPGAVNQTIKSCMVGFTGHQLADGERVTLVAYDDQGGPISQAQLLIINSKAIRQSDRSKKYVSGIQIESPLISPSDPKVIEFPLNVTVESVPMMGVVNYRGGDVNKIGIDGIYMSLFGLEDYIATEVGQEFPLTLSYRLANDEVSYGTLPTAERIVTESYIARTMPVDGAYSCMLFVYPHWVSDVVGYRLEFWLYNLDRQRYYNVTGNVQLGVNSAPFYPKQYGTAQTLTYTVNLNEVDGRFAPYRFVSTFQIALIGPGNNRNANWIFNAKPGIADGYGRDLKADLEHLQANAWDLRLANGASVQEDWLRKMYFAAEPLVNPDLEAYAPTPTHFVIHMLHNKYEFNVSQWNQKLRVNNDLENGELLYIQWIHRTPVQDLQLAMTALPVYIR